MSVKVLPSFDVHSQDWLRTGRTPRLSGETTSVWFCLCAVTTMLLKRSTVMPGSYPPAYVSVVSRTGAPNVGPPGAAPAPCATNPTPAAAHTAAAMTLRMEESSLVVSQGVEPGPAWFRRLCPISCTPSLASAQQRTRQL